jgi:hypothetical protein
MLDRGELLPCVGSHSLLCSGPPKKPLGQSQTDPVHPTAQPTFPGNCHHQRGYLNNRLNAPHHAPPLSSNPQRITPPKYSYKSESVYVN